MLLAAVVCLSLLQPSPPAATPPATPAPAAKPATPAKPAKPVGTARLKADSAALAPLMQSALGKAFAAAGTQLPEVEPRSLYLDEKNRRWLTPADAAALDDAARAALKPRTLDEQFYYTTRYGSPLSYSRAMDVLVASGAFPDSASLAGKKILDYGCGGIGPMRLWALLGADAVGVDIDPMLRLLYSNPGDQGRFGERAGKVSYVTGRWPGEAETAAAVGKGFDLIISKNTLKNGYLHPAREVDKRMLVDLGVSEPAFLAAIHDALKPGGVLLIYNLSPAPSKPDEPYKPWSDGRSPFSPEQFKAAGLEVLAHDRTDDAAARAMAKALGWDSDGMDVENDLFAHFTIARRPAAAN